MSSVNQQPNGFGLEIQSQFSLLENEKECDKKKVWSDCFY